MNTSQRQRPCATRGLQQPAGSTQRVWRLRKWRSLTHQITTPSAYCPVAKQKQSSTAGRLPSDPRSFRCMCKHVGNLCTRVESCCAAQQNQLRSTLPTLPTAASQHSSCNKQGAGRDSARSKQHEFQRAQLPSHCAMSTSSCCWLPPGCSCWYCSMAASNTLPMCLQTLLHSSQAVNNACAAVTSPATASGNQQDRAGLCHT